MFEFVQGAYVVSAGGDVWALLATSLLSAPVSTARLVFRTARISCRCYRQSLFAMKVKCERGLRYSLRQDLNPRLTRPSLMNGSAALWNDGTSYPTCNTISTSVKFSSTLQKVVDTPRHTQDKT